MDNYQPHHIRIRKEDQALADDILMRHWVRGDLDDITGSRDGDTILLVVYPYVYEDFVTITDEFKEAGIHIM